MHPIFSTIWGFFLKKKFNNISGELYFKVKGNKKERLKLGIITSMVQTPLTIKPFYFIFFYFLFM